MLVKIKKYRESVKDGCVGGIYKQIFVASMAASACFTHGLQSGWISPVQKLLQSESSPSGSPLTGSEMTWLASTLSLVAGLSIFVHIYNTDVCGRKIAILFTIASQAVSWIILLISSNFPSLIASRALAGIGSAGSFIHVPTYIKETCQDNIRGTLVTLCLSFQYCGILAVYAMGSYLNYYTTIEISLGYSLISLVIVFIAAPETPPFLVKKGKDEEATAVVAKFRGLDTDHDIVQKEINYVKSQNELYKTMPRITLKTIYENKAWRRGTILSIAMIAGVGFNGSTAIFTYAQYIVSQCGVAIDPELQTLSVPILMILGVLVPLTCADRVGRKPLLLWTFILSAVALAVLASSLLVMQYGIAFPSYIPVIAMATIVCAFSMGVLVMPQVIMSEMFRFEVRAKLVSFVLMQMWLLITLQLAFCDFVSKIIGLHGVFYVFAAVNLISGVLVGLFVPETKGKTVEEIEDILLGDKVDSSDF